MQSRTKGSQFGTRCDDGRLQNGTPTRGILRSSWMTMSAGSKNTFGEWTTSMYVKPKRFGGASGFRKGVFLDFRSPLAVLGMVLLSFHLYLTEIEFIAGFRSIKVWDISTRATFFCNPRVLHAVQYYGKLMTTMLLDSCQRSNVSCRRNIFFTFRSLPFYCC